MSTSGYAPCFKPMFQACTHSSKERRLEPTGRRCRECTLQLCSAVSDSAECAIGSEALTAASGAEPCLGVIPAALTYPCRTSSSMRCHVRSCHGRHRRNTEQCTQTQHVTKLGLSWRVESGWKRDHPRWYSTGSAWYGHTAGAYPHRRRGPNSRASCQVYEFLG